MEADHPTNEDVTPTAAGEAEWPLVCPICDAPLSRSGASLRDSAGHTFDLAREGYVNLQPSHHRSRGIDGDLPSMLQARRRFLEAGHYAPLLALLAEQVAGAIDARAARGATGPTSVLEVGCGEGYYLGGVQRFACERADCAHVRFLGSDIAKAAVKLAARAYPDATFFVADLNRRLYVEDASVTVLLDVFAPRNPEEFARVLEPGGRLLVVVPAPEHLASARERLGLLGIEPDKEGKVIERFSAGFELADRQRLAYPIFLGARDLDDLVAMGPNEFHRERREEAGETAPSEVAADTLFATEAAFSLLVFERRP